MEIFSISCTQLLHTFLCCFFFSFVNKYHLQASLPYIVEQQFFYNTTIITLFTMFTIIYMKRRPKNEHGRRVAVEKKNETFMTVYMCGYSPIYSLPKTLHVQYIFKIYTYNFICAFTSEHCW